MADTEGAVIAVYTAERVRVWLSWLYVGIPLAWGVLQTLSNALLLFK